ncbi:sensor histidine kinase KdpD [Nannocystis sp. ILAH1]|uniref:sensor histidine kinase n=1 Tax=unclassified Nannocystis TaxID=2627009 RepID=UPI00226FC35A|nr:MULTISPECIES: sensor histidine kinase KdpD [unclassified Nannocystis]MCY0987989.1 sensor histidine kinase KdpD [Nannocystis sp. ILAH1]MCY1065668.1 sensor histidine kinase KdpD [Nannocystis sp. RBIL2]
MNRTELDGDRPDPEALLEVARAEEARAKRGELKIFFGAAPGVGKTYAMLEAARRARAEKIDVVVGVVETHGRSETAALLEGLERLAPRTIEYRGKPLQEFDLEAALARRPGLLLVDELAHTNVPGSQHRKRWQDVDLLLSSGIDIYTTLNVQHLESLNDVVAQITWVRVRETVPDAVFDRADDVELCDLPADELLERLQEGKVYLPEQARHATEAFFRKGNLLALRELALRRMAQRVDSDVHAYRRAHGISTTWAMSERILVCIGPSQNGPRLVRAAARMAAGLRAEWIALHVETPRLALVRVTGRGTLAETIRLAESLGAEVVNIGGESIGERILEYARARNVTRLVVGKPSQPRWRELLGGSVLDTLVRGSGAIDVHVISGDEGPLARRPTLQPATPSGASPIPYAWAVAGVVGVTGVCTLLYSYIDLSDIIMLYLLVIMVTAARFGRGPSILAAVVSVAAFNFCFVPPFYTFAVADARYMLTFGVMLLVGIVISGLTERVRMQAEAARGREQRTAILYSLSRELAQLRHKQSIGTSAARHVAELAGGRVVVLVAGADDSLTPLQGTDVELVADPLEQAAARQALERGPAGAGTDTLSSAKALYVPLQAVGRTIGVLGVTTGDPVRLRHLAEQELLAAMSGQVALALHRVLLAQEAQQAELRARTEELRGALLSSVSHDLRTPLTAISTAASVLGQAGPMADEKRREFASSIYEEALGLGRLVTNLLHMTRLETPGVALRREWTPLEDPIGAALTRLERALGRHMVNVSLAPDLPPVLLDEVLFEHLMLNLLENAAKYTPPGSAIDVSARVEGASVVVEVADRGGGIPAGQEDRIFEKYFRVGGPAQGGFGLGLAICRAIAVAHGGTITAANRPQGGALFCVTMPIGEETQTALPSAQEATA